MGFDFNKLSILIIEDNKIMIKLIASVLETLGVGTILTAENGDAGFQMFCNKNPDIVITDWQMEPVTGIEVINKIRTSPKSPNKTAPVIIMTGFSALPRIFKARDMGATEFLVKPFSANGLARRIAYVITRPRDFIRTPNYFGPDRRRRIIENYKGPRRRAKDQKELKKK
jgi:CheY-like chemotaxis protein